MSKIKTQYVCSNCGGTTVRLMGKCPHCGEWNTLSEEIIETASFDGKNRYQGFVKTQSKVTSLESVLTSEYSRKPSKIQEFDRVLGGGFVNGGVILLGGDPGIGKSTLLLQVISALASDSKTLYVSGEESIEQIAIRGKRLKLPLKNIRIYGEIELEKIQQTIEKEKPNYVVIDSIQTLFSSQLSSAPGSVTQVKECASHLNRYAKETGTTMIIICHVTKDGDLAGPRALEHIVDTVLYFEGDKNNQYRMIRALKNRFGPINEIGMFAMTECGLVEVDDPTGIFLNGHNPLPGAAIYVTQEGNRPILVELQALLDATPLPNPIRRSIGFDLNRLQMLCAVINKYYEMPIYSHNVFVSLIGGMKFSDTGIDLPAFLAMISSYKNKSILHKTVSFGEIGLTGEIRQVQNFEDRIREAQRLGMKHVIMPLIQNKGFDKNKYAIKIMECNTLQQALEYAFER